jgi:carbon storage regulator
MLVLTRSREESIMIGENIEVRVLEVRGGRVRLGIGAPSHVSIYRGEIYRAIQQENLEAARAAEGENTLPNVLPSDVKKSPDSAKKSLPSSNI